MHNSTCPIEVFYFYCLIIFLPYLLLFLCFYLFYLLFYLHKFEPFLGVQNVFIGGKKTSESGIEGDLSGLLNLVLFSHLFGKLVYAFSN